MESEINEDTKLTANKSFSHQLKFGVERLLSNDKLDYSTKNNLNQESLQTLNLQFNNGYHSLNVNNNPCYRNGYSTSDLFVRNGAFFNYFHQKNLLTSRENNNCQQRIQSLRPIKTEFNMPTTNSTTNTSSQQSNNNNVKRKRSWSRAVFSNLQRKGLERQFEFQKYITKPDRKKLAARLGLKDAQVKVWFQNRRMKWRHSTITSSNKNSSTFKIEGITSSSDEDDEIDVVSDVSYEMG